MTTQSSDRTGILIVRLWIEGNPLDGFRARITHSLDAADAEKVEHAAGDSAQVCAIVQRWIDDFVSAN